MEKKFLNQFHTLTFDIWGEADADAEAKAEGEKKPTITTTAKLTQSIKP